MSDTREQSRLPADPLGDSRLPAAALDLLPGFAAVVEPDYRIAYLNRGFAQVYSPVDGQRCYEACFGLNQPCEDCPAQRVLASGQPEDWEETQPNGRSFHMWVLPFAGWPQQRQVLKLGIDITEQRKLEAILAESSERIRRATGRNLHDALGQTLAGLGYLVQGLADKQGDRLGTEQPTIRAILSAINDAIRQVRCLARGLDPVGLDDHGLHAAMASLVQNAATWFGVDVRLEWSCPSEVRPGAASHLYYITQEALNNVARHAEARRAVVSLHQNEQHLVLQICDDGKGMPPGVRNAGLGMKVMQHRAASLGGRLFVTAAEPCGTVVTCKAPKARLLDKQGEDHD
jgi:signal transduction histidine kinase